MPRLSGLSYTQYRVFFLFLSQVKSLGTQTKLAADVRFFGISCMRVGIQTTDYSTTVLRYTDYSIQTLGLLPCSFLQTFTLFSCQLLALTMTCSSISLPLCERQLFLIRTFFSTFLPLLFFFTICISSISLGCFLFAF